MPFPTLEYQYRTTFRAFLSKLILGVHLGEDFDFGISRKLQIVPSGRLFGRGRLLFESVSLP